MFGLKLWFSSCVIICICPSELPLEDKAMARESPHFRLWFLSAAEHKTDPSALILHSFMGCCLVLTAWCLHHLSERKKNKNTVHIWPLARTRRLNFELIRWPKSMKKNNFYWWKKGDHLENKQEPKEKGMKFKGKTSTNEEIKGYFHWNNNFLSDNLIGS